ncbi:MAG: glycosyltransferase family 39 protein [Saprospirales bacterium]|nr:glycosyltransferase family 39 protein [Saprospirales bacterium]
MSLIRFLVAALVLFFLFFRLGQPPVFEYDEARNGINAVEMLEHGHWRGLWFANEPDTWVNKPPLFTWILAGSFSILGYNTLALRIPSALAMLGALFFVYLLGRRYYGEVFAIMACLVLLSVKGLVGHHTGRTGDFDALLIFFLMANSYFFMRFFSGGKEWNLTLASLLLAGAFMTKGPAMAVLLPGQAIFLALTGAYKDLNWKLLVRQLLLFSIIPLIWLVFINEDQAPGRLISYDILERFSDTGFETPQNPSQFSFFIVCMDAYFNLWNYVLYGLLAVVSFFPKKAGFSWNWKDNPLLVYSLACWLSLGLLLSLAATTHRWYFSPALPFVAITMVFLLRKMAKHKLVWVLFGALLLFTLSRRALEIAHEGGPLPPMIERARPFLEQAERVFYVGSLPSQRDLLYLYFIEPQLICLACAEELPELRKGDAVVAVRNDTIYSLTPTSANILPVSPFSFRCEK